MTKRLLTSLIALSILSGCSKVVIEDPQIRAHWMKEGEAAPFDGILLNDYTYMKLREKLDECE